MPSAVFSPIETNHRLTTTYLSTKQWTILLIISLAFLLPGFATIPVTDRDEARYAQASKQMIETNDYVDIRFQDQTRYVKPIATYWLQSASANLINKITGQSSAKIWAYRLPSLLASLIAIAAVAWLGTLMAGPSVGLLSGIILASTLIVGIEARTAKTDALLLAATTMAQASLFLIWNKKDEKKLPFIGAPLIFWLATALGLLIKGPLILLVSVTTIITLSIWTNCWHWLKNLSPLKGLLIIALLVAPWLTLIIIKTKGQFLTDSLGHAMLGKVTRSDDSHGMPPGTHLILYFACFWPMGILTALQNIYAFKNRNKVIVRFLLCWIWPSWIIFELVVTKLPHYTLPLYPAIAILSSMALLEAKNLLKDKLTRRLHSIILVIFTLFTLALAAMPALIEHHFQLNYSLFSLLTFALGLTVIISGLYFGIAPNQSRIIPLLISTILFYTVTFQWTLPAIDPLWPSDRLAKITTNIKGCNRKIITIAGYPEPSNVFLQGTTTKLTTGKNAAHTIAAHPECTVAIIETRYLSEFLQTASLLKIQPSLIQALSGYNVSKGKQIKLNLYLSQTSKLKLTKQIHQHHSK